VNLTSTLDTNAPETKEHAAPSYEEDSFMCDSDPALEVRSVVLATPDSQVDSQCTQEVQEPLSSVQHDHTYFSPPPVGETSVKKVESSTKRVELAISEVESVISGVESGVSAGLEPKAMELGLVEGGLSQELFSDEEGDKEVLGSATVGVASPAHSRRDNSSTGDVFMMEVMENTRYRLTEGVGLGNRAQGPDGSTVEPNMEVPVSQPQGSNVEPRLDRMELDLATLVQKCEHHKSSIPKATSIDHTHSPAAGHIQRNPMIRQIMGVLPSMNTILEKTPDIAVDDVLDMVQMVIQLHSTLATRLRNGRRN
jgi:hypothetical protein